MNNNSISQCHLLLESKVDILGPKKAINTPELFSVSEQE